MVLTNWPPMIFSALVTNTFTVRDAWNWTGAGMRTEVVLSWFCMVVGVIEETGLGAMVLGMALVQATFTSLVIMASLVCGATDWTGGEAGARLNVLVLSAFSIFWMTVGMVERMGPSPTVPGTPYRTPWVPIIFPSLVTNIFYVCGA